MSRRKKLFDFKFVNASAIQLTHVMEFILIFRILKKVLQRIQRGFGLKDQIISIKLISDRKDRLLAAVRN